MARKIKPQATPQEDIRIQEFLDMIAPSVVKFCPRYKSPLMKKEPYRV